MASSRKEIRKRKVLSIEQKLEICELVKKGTSYDEIMKTYGIGKSTISDIKKKEQEFKEFVSKKAQLGIKNADKVTKVMKTGSNNELDQTLYLWFRQCREKNIPVTGPILLEKASAFYNLLYPDATKSFSGSTGFQWRFCNRFGIRNLAIAGEKLSADKSAAYETISEFPELIEGYLLPQIFNCEETGLCYRLLPTKTLVGGIETKADGLKKAKDRITVNACANVTGDIKLPLLFIGKAKNPRCFKGINQSTLPVIYRNQRNAWMDTEIFSWWFHKQFVPFVRAKLPDMGLEEKAILFLDHCSAHPEAEDLISNDGKITARFFRPNVTALVQPMDQGVLESMKRVYRKNLLRDFISKTSNEMIPFLKEMNMLDVINRISIAWDQVASDTIRKSWGKLIPLPVPDVNEGMPDASEELMELLTELDVDASQKDINDWFENDGPGYEHLNDESIIGYVSKADDAEKDDEDVDEIEMDEPEYPVTNKMAMDAFDTCLAWLQFQSEATAVNTTMLLQLRELAAQKRESSRKQTRIESFFKKDNFSVAI